MRISLILFLVLIPINLISQTEWTSRNFDYTIEIPQGFEMTKAVGANVDFKATKGSASVVININRLPNEYIPYSIWDLLGDLNTFPEEWEEGAREYMNNPTFIKSGKTTVDVISAFWYDYTTSNPDAYSKVYQFKKDDKLFTITLTNSGKNQNNYAAIWFRFKEKIRLN